jgi:hypothetical protein
MSLLAGIIYTTAHNNLLSQPFITYSPWPAQSRLLASPLEAVALAKLCPRKLPGRPLLPQPQSRRSAVTSQAVSYHVFFSRLYTKHIQLSLCVKSAINRRWPTSSQPSESFPSSDLSAKFPGGSLRPSTKMSCGTRRLRSRHFKMLVSPGSLVSLRVS